MTSGVLGFVFLRTFFLGVLLGPCIVFFGFGSTSLLGAKIGPWSSCSDSGSDSLLDVSAGLLSGSGVSAVADRSCEGWGSESGSSERWELDLALDPLCFVFLLPMAKLD